MIAISDTQKLFPITNTICDTPFVIPNTTWENNFEVNLSSIIVAKNLHKHRMTCAKNRKKRKNKKK